MHGSQLIAGPWLERWLGRQLVPSSSHTAFAFCRSRAVPSSPRKMPFVALVPLLWHSRRCRCGDAMWTSVTLDLRDSLYSTTSPRTAGCCPFLLLQTSSASSRVLIATVGLVSALSGQIISALDTLVGPYSCLNKPTIRFHPPDILNPTIRRRTSLAALSPRVSLAIATATPTVT
jgi:hypothetical protein